VRQDLRPAGEVADDLEDALARSLDEDGGGGVQKEEKWNRRCGAAVYRLSEPKYQLFRSIR
jgi:hypothetical protein